MSLVQAKGSRSWKITITASLIALSGTLVALSGNLWGTSNSAGGSSYDVRPSSSTNAVVSSGVNARRAWGLLKFDALEVEHYFALGAMSDSSTTVISGVVQSVTSGRTFGSEEDGYAYYANATVKIGEILDGGNEERPGETITVEVLIPNADSAGVLDAGLRGQEGIFFLRNKGEEAKAMGLPEETQAEESRYYRWVSSQGVLLNMSGRVWTPLYDDADFPAELRGQSYKNVKDRVKTHGSKSDP